MPAKNKQSSSSQNKDLVNSLIAKFKTKHGEKYDYSKVRISAHTANYWHKKITVTCPKHGDFYPTPGNHFYKNSGCRDCSFSNIKPRRNTSEFIAEAYAKHGDRYDYSQVSYERGNKKVRIICQEHGPFDQTPTKHLTGQGCNDCANARRNDSKRGTTEEFIAKALTIHQQKYNYDEVIYKDFHTKVKIICTTHGSFFQAPAQHLAGQGCRDCGIEKRTRAQAKGQTDFIQEIRAIFGSDYDYKNIRYLNAHKPVELICKKPGHGSFHRPPVDLIKGNGCQICGYERSSQVQRLTNEEFVQRAEKQHNGLYTYPNLSYGGLSKTIIAHCYDHGDFEQNAGNHLAGKGCGRCADEIKALFGKTVAQHRKDGTDVAGRLYVLHMFSDDEQFFKIGITSKTIQTRWKSLGDIYDYEVLADLPMGIVRAWSIEQEFLRQHEKHKYDPKIYFGGVTECFVENPLDLDTYLHEEVSRQL